VHRRSTPRASNGRRAFAVLSCALAIAACGSSGKSSTAAGTGTTSGSTQYAQGVRFSDCMRSHAVPNFPDPSPSGGLPSGSLAGISLGSPAFLSAKQACDKLEPGGGTAPRLSESRKLAALAWAKCVRKHGLPDLQDPTFPSSGGIVIERLNLQSPAVKEAKAACGVP
jgi:hypothetical protein